MQWTEVYLTGSSERYNDSIVFYEIKNRRGKHVFLITDTNLHVIF